METSDEVLGRGLRRAAGVVCALVLGGCAAGHPPGPSYAKEEPGLDAPAVVAAADWRKTIDVKVEMVDYGYRPREIRLTAGLPYRLTLINYSSIDHYFTAPEFFRSVATRKAMVQGYAEVKAPYFTAVEVMRRGGTIDLYLVPMVKGRYPVHCQLNDHRERGVEGVIIVE